MELKFRDVTADEIDCRVATVKQNGCSLLLYKDARCDQNILDETVGAMNWQRAHTRDNANCIVSIWDTDKNAWVSKEDTGTESYTEKEKGLASDSFKRACFNWGIGRELYTAPFIWVSSQNCEIRQKGSGWTTYDRFEVSKLTVEKKKITELEVVNAKTGDTVFRLVKKKKVATKKKEEAKTQTRGKAPDEESEELTPAFVHEIEVEAPKTREEFVSPITDEEKAAVIREMRRTLVSEETLVDCVKKPMKKWTRGEAHSILRRLAKTQTREKAPKKVVPVEEVVNDAELPWGQAVAIEDL